MSQDPAGPDGMLAQAIASTRAEQDGDAAFLFALFCRSRAPGEDLAFFDPALREQLMRSQFIGQSASYRAAFPDARYEIVEQGGAPAGRIVWERSGEALRLIDIALLPDRRRRGIGTGLIRSLMARAREAGLPLRLSVAMHNGDALRLYQRLGFSPTESAPPMIEMEWRGAADGELVFSSPRPGLPR
jgi:ribosomal protein S18 acetylase RimI-like enzyme